MATKRNIIVADDHPIYRSAIVHALSSSFETISAFEASNIKDLEQIIHDQKLNVDLIILDLHMPGVSGFEGLAYLSQNYNSVPVIMISADEETNTISFAKKHGARGFIKKTAHVNQICEAIKTVLEGADYFPEFDETIEKTEVDMLVEKVASLTGRQLEVFNLLGKGMLNKQIAYELNITEATIKAHLTAIMRKLGVFNRTEVILIANKINKSHYSS